MKLKALYFRFLIWRIKHISNRNFAVILSGFIGAISGLAAVVLKSTVHFIQGVLTSGFDIKLAHYLYFGYPLIGILLTSILINYILKARVGHGITYVLYSISKKSSIMSRVKMYASMLTSAITVGFGGSAGLEAPIVVTGSSIGSNIGRLFHLGYNKRTLLIGCGAAGAISAIFNSPVAGVIFSIEVILVDVTITSFIPLLIASVCGSLVSLSLLGEDILFSFKLKDPFVAGDVPYYILLGIVCGLVAVYFTRVLTKVERVVVKINKVIPRALAGGLGLGLIIFVFPPIYGEGYNTIKLLLANAEQDLLNNSLFFNEIDHPFFLLFFMFGILLIKPVATALTIGSGGNGGVFAPSLFIGGVTGFMFAKSTNMILGSGTISKSNFTLVAMCGVMSGVQRAPLTAIFLIAEITSGYVLFVPLMLVSAIAYITSLYFESHSLYTKTLIEEGDLIQGDRDRQVLSLIDLDKIVEKDLLTIKPEANLGELVELVRRSKRNIFPVVNDQHELMGIVTLDDIREIMFDNESRKNVIIESVMHSPPSHVSSREEMKSVMEKFEKTGAWNLPVIDNGKYAGFVSKSRIFNAYRVKLMRQNKD